VAEVGTSKAGGTISQQAVVHPWLAADARGNKQKHFMSMMMMKFSHYDRGLTIVM
jgi:hypothetical protein